MNCKKGWIPFAKFAFSMGPMQWFRKQASLGQLGEAVQ
jgi:hypothetical protein